MTGNDIVDKAFAAKESNWKRKGFLEKIFTLHEQLSIRESSQPFHSVWQLWSMKESAYKIYSRQFGGRFFSPAKIECTLLSGSNGLVTINQKKYNTTTAITNNYIYSIAKPSGSNIPFFQSSCFYNKIDEYEKSNQLVIEKIKNNYAAITGIKKTDLSLIKDKNNIPYLFCGEDHTKIPVSITHHGNYAAFTIN